MTSTKMELRTVKLGKEIASSVPVQRKVEQRMDKLVQARVMVGMDLHIRKKVRIRNGQRTMISIGSKIALFVIVIWVRDAIIPFSCLRHVHRRFHLKLS